MEQRVLILMNVKQRIICATRVGQTVSILSGRTSASAEPVMKNLVKERHTGEFGVAT